MPSIMLNSIISRVSTSSRSFSMPLCQQVISAAIGAAHMMGTPRSRFSSISGENTTITPLVYSTTTPV